MYEIIRISVLGMILAVLTVVIRNIKPEYTVAVSICGICLILTSVISSVGNLFEQLISFSSKYSVDDTYVSTVVKVSGISFVCSFAAETCRDSGSAAVAATVETTGRILVVSAVMPLALTLTETVIEIINVNVF